MASSSAAAGPHGDTRQDQERAEERALTGLLSDDTLLHMMRRLSTRDLLSSLAFVCHRWRRLCRSFSVYELVPSPLNPRKKPWGNMRRKKLLELAATHASTLERVHLHGSVFCPCFVQQGRDCQVMNSKMCFTEGLVILSTVEQNCTLGVFSPFWLSVMLWRGATIGMCSLKQFRSKEVIALCRSVPKLQDLSIVSCPDFWTKDLELVANQLPTQLISLDIHGDNVVALPCQVNDKILADLYQRCPQLQKLDLDIISEITPKGLDGLLQACQSLTSLDLESHLLGWPEVAQVFKSCKSLCHLSLMSPILGTTSRNDDNENMDGFYDTYSRAAKQWGMDEFYVSAAISFGVEMPKHLTSLRLYSTPYRSVSFEVPPMLAMLQTKGHQLRQLHAQGVFNTSWQTISVWCANLKLLDLTHCRRTNLILTEVEEVVLCGLIKLLKKLEHIALPSATDHILTELGRFCSNLREIRFPNTTLRNTAVTDRGVFALAEGCPDLRVLSLSGCQNLTISSARALAFHCRKLQVLLLNRCDNVTDAAVVALLPRLSRSLVFLNLVGCQITQSALEAIRQYAKVTSLQVVEIAKPLWLKSQSVIADIHSYNPRLRIRSESGVLWDGFYHGTAID